MRSGRGNNRERKFSRDFFHVRSPFFFPRLRKSRVDSSPAAVQEGTKTGHAGMHKRATEIEPIESLASYVWFPISITFNFCTSFLCPARLSVVVTSGNRRTRAAKSVAG